VLAVFNHRFASADPISIAFSGELLAMVVIGGMRSFLGPALGALFYVLFREFLSMWTENWLLIFGLLFVGFIVFSPTGLVGVAGRLLAPFRKKTEEAAAMSARRAGESGRVPERFIRRPRPARGRGLCWRRGHQQVLGGIRAVRGADIRVGDARCTR
jgi:hypothetical protein